MAIYLDVIALLKRLGLVFQHDIHDPVKAVGRIQEFTWSMGKLKLSVDKAIENRAP